MKVSVIIPTYNRAHLISEAIDSVLKQTYQNLEIIVVDDGSTDGTRELLEAYGDKIRYYPRENRGAGAARNYGLKQAKGEYIAFLDSDDTWMDYKLELQVGIMENLPEIGFLSTEFRIMRDSGDVIHSGLRTWHKEVKPWESVYEKSIKYSDLHIETHPLQNDFLIYVGNLYYPLLNDPYVLPSSSIVRRSRLKPDIQFAEGMPVYEDWEFFARLAHDNMSAFLDIETTVNRGHVDDVRLTLCDQKTKAENRLRLIERVWKSDTEFRQNYERDIAAVESEQMIILTKQFLLESNNKKAREVLKRWSELNVPCGCSYPVLLKILTYLPGCTWLILVIRRLRSMAFSCKTV